MMTVYLQSPKILSINILSDEQIANSEYGFISTELIMKYANDNSQYFYLCGLEPMMQAVEKHLSYLGISESYIVKEAF